jgi:hypothetical protein
VGRRRIALLKIKEGREVIAISGLESGLYGLCILLSVNRRVVRVVEQDQFYLKTHFFLLDICFRLLSKK